MGTWAKRPGQHGTTRPARWSAEALLDVGEQDAERGAVELVDGVEPEQDNHGEHRSPARHLESHLPG
jgi:hypothetical protein